MNTSNRILLISLFFAIAAIAVLATRLGNSPSPQSLGLESPSVDPAEAPSKGPVVSPRQTVSAHALARAQEQLDHLQAALGETEQLLQRRTESLRKKDAECSALQAELDETIAFYFSSLEGKESGQSPAATNLSNQLRNLQTEFEQRTQSWVEQTLQLDALREAVVSSELRMAELRAAAEEEISVLVADQEAFLVAFQNALGVVGEDVVPALSSMLTEPRPVVRAWAASMLSRLGPDALSAIPALERLLQDESEQVRLEARRALAAIEG